MRPITSAKAQAIHLGMHMIALCGDCCPKTLQNTAVLSGHITSALVESRYLKTSVSSECFGRGERRKPNSCNFAKKEETTRFCRKEQERTESRAGASQRPSGVHFRETCYAETRIQRPRSEAGSNHLGSFNQSANLRRDQHENGGIATSEAA